MKPPQPAHYLLRHCALLSIALTLLLSVPPIHADRYTPTIQPSPPTTQNLTIDEVKSHRPDLVDVWVQQAYVKASNTDAEDHFGNAVAIDGDTMVIGAPYESSSATGINGDQTDNSAINSGAVYVFTRANGAWRQEAYLKASNAEMYDNFGVAVAISGNTIVVGAESEASSATGVNGDQGDNSVSHSGAAYVFVRSGGIWSQQAYLKASTTTTSDYFGRSVAISGDTIAVGAVYGDLIAGPDIFGPGVVYVFTRSGNTWSQQAQLQASNSEHGDMFADSVAISGDTIVVSAYLEDSNATGVNGNQADNSAPYAGAAYVFVRSGETWSQQAYLKASNTGPGYLFGHSVAISGDTIAVGALSEGRYATGVNGDQADNSVSSSGIAYIFTRTGSTWSPQASVKASNAQEDDMFGFAIAIDGDTLVIGAIHESSSATGINGDQTDNSVRSSGAAYIFTRSGETWSQQAYVKASNTDELDNFGTELAMSGDTIVVGVQQERSAATGIHGNQADNSAPYAGAAYVFFTTTFSHHYDLPLILRPDWGK